MIVPVDEVTGLIGAVVPTARNMKQNHYSMSLPHYFVHFKQNCLKAAWVYYFLYTDF